jgi:hypothetical protein
MRPNLSNKLAGVVGCGPSTLQGLEHTHFQG